MSRLKLRITLNKGQHGIKLQKLENVVEELRKFLASAGEDINLSEPTAWVGVDFRNSSLEFVSEYSHGVGGNELSRFNGALVSLTHGEFPPSFRKSTSDYFFDITEYVDQDEIIHFAVFEEDGSEVPLELSKKTALAARSINVLPFRESLGAVQGRIHSLHKESDQPYFTLRELSTENLIKCFYGPEDYAAIVQALKEKNQVVHVKGKIVTDTRGRSIKHVRVQRIVLAEPFGYEDVEKFLRA